MVWPDFILKIRFTKICRGTLQCFAGIRWYQTIFFVQLTVAVDLGSYLVKYLFFQKKKKRGNMVTLCSVSASIYPFY